jgi:FkbM family methyltransferase
MFDKIVRIKTKGFEPDLILDIGAEKGSWTNQMLSIYPSAKYIMFEAISYGELSAFCLNHNIPYHNSLLFDKETEVDWYEMRNTGDSIFKERGQAFQNCHPIKKMTTTLEKELQNYDLEDKKNVLIKIDCQGAELPILKGAGKILEKTQFIILEIPLFGQYNQGVPDFLEHIQYMDSIGFIAYDIAECHIINGFCRQVDMIFISKSHIFNQQTEFH